MKGLELAQLQYDNLLPRDYFVDDTGREEWESDLDITDLLTTEEIDEALWTYLSDQPWFQARLDEKWEEYRQACRQQDEEDAAADRAADRWAA